MSSELFDNDIVLFYHYFSLPTLLQKLYCILLFFYIFSERGLVSATFSSFYCWLLRSCWKYFSQQDCIISLKVKQNCLNNLLCTRNLLIIKRKIITLRLFLLKFLKSDIIFVEKIFSALIIFKRKAVEYFTRKL